MLRIYRTAFCSCCAAALAAILCCSSPMTVDSGGTGQETTNGVVMGKVYSKDGQPLPGSVVKLYHWEKIPSDTGFVDSTTTDKSGSYAFARLAGGDYAIVSSSVDSASRVLNDSVALLSDSALEQVRDTVEPVGSLSGMCGIAVPDGAIACAVLIKTPFRARVDVSGLFHFPALPPRSYELAIVLFSAFEPSAFSPVIVALDSIIVAPGSVTVADSLTLIQLGTGSGNRLLIDDFADGNLINNVGTRWYTFNESYRGGESKATLGLDSLIHPDSSGFSMQLAYSFDTTMTPPLVGAFVYWDWRQPGYNVTIDVSNISRISFDVRGGPHELRCGLAGSLSDGVYDMWSTQHSMDQWTHVDIEVDSVVQTWDAQKQSSWEAGRRFISFLQFTTMGTDAALPDSGNWWIDNVAVEIRTN